ncbi:MAG: hypothetical protein ACR2M0_07255 [Chloroflexia bacterium]
MYEQSPFDKAGSPRSKIGFKQFFVGLAVFVVALVILMNAVIRPALQAAHATPTARPTPTGPASTAAASLTPPPQATAAGLMDSALRLYGPKSGTLTQTTTLLSV